MNPTDPEPPIQAEPAGEPDDFKAMLIGASLIFVITFIPYAVVLCCLPQIFAAMLAIHIFTKKYQLTLTYGDGIKLGILTVLMGSLSAMVVAVLLNMLTGYQVGHEVQDIMLNLMTKYAPQAVPAMQDAIAKQKAEGITAKMLAIQACSAVIGACVSGLIGGALGSALFKRGPKPE